VYPGGCLLACLLACWVSDSRPADLPTPCVGCAQYVTSNGGGAVKCSYAGMHVGCCAAGQASTLACLLYAVGCMGQHRMSRGSLLVGICAWDAARRCTLQAWCLLPPTPHMSHLTLPSYACLGGDGYWLLPACRPAASVGCGRPGDVLAAVPQSVNSVSGLSQSRFAHGRAWCAGCLCGCCCACSRVSMKLCLLLAAVQQLYTKQHKVAQAEACSAVDVLWCPFVVYMCCSKPQPYALTCKLGARVPLVNPGACLLLRSCTVGTCVPYMRVKDHLWVYWYQNIRMMHVSESTRHLLTHRVT
jgi:hypothetical protein